jgi:probable phosphoglycerate mutase
MELVLIRHGLPIRDDRSADPPLSDEGRRQSGLLSDWLGRRPVFDAIYTSPMARAMQTAGPYASVVGKEAVVEEGVAEIGRDSGQYVPLEELKRSDYAAWRRTVDRGLRSEDEVLAFQKVVVSALERLVLRHAGQRIAVFCHGGVINVWASHVLRMAPRMFFEPHYTSVNRFLCAGSGQRNIASLNGLAHLDRD